MTDIKKRECIERAGELVNKMTIAEAATQLCYDALELPHLGVPAYNWWNEALHGVARAGTATVFPQAIGLGAMFDPELLQTIADVISTEARAKYNASSAYGDRDIYKGLTFWSPNVNIFRDPRWGRGHETYGEDPYLTSRNGVAFVKGLQGDGELLKVAACAKHFAVHSGPERLRHEFNAVCSLKDLWETYLPAFEACVKEADVEAVMGAYNRTLDEPCCASQLLLVEILRGKWQFEGHIVSDCWALRDIYQNHKVVDTAEAAAALALKAGCDLNCGSVYSVLMDAYDSGLVTEEDIRTSAKRLMATRFRLGILGDDGCEYDNIPYDAVDSPEHVELNIKAAAESAVLLKNNGLLPLDISKLSKIAIIGPNADSRVALKGNYHGTPSRSVTINEGVRGYAGDRVRVLYSEGCMLASMKAESLALENDLISEAVTAASASDVTVLVVGLDETIEGEETNMIGIGFDGDKSDLMLPEPQRILLDAVIATGKPVVVILMAGSSIDMRVADAAPNVGAILNAWYPGAQGGTAIAKLLFGDCSPCGKLPITFYNSSDDLPDFEDYALNGRTYRYFKGNVLYPFGYGLTYGDVFVESASYKDGKMSVVIKNEACMDTKDVVQIYVKAGSEYAPLNPRLCAFKKVEIDARCARIIEIEIPHDAFTVVNDSGDRVSGGPLYSFFVGMGQPGHRTAELYGHDCIEVKVSI